MELDLFDLENYFFKDIFVNGEQPWQALEKIESYLDAKKEELLRSGFTLHGEALVAKDVKIHAQATIEGKALIDSGTEVRAGALIRKGAIIGKNCTIGHASEIKHSIMLNHASAGHFNYVGDSIVGNEANLGAGVVLANLKSGSRSPEIYLMIRGQRVNSGLRKLGCLVGDGVKIGSNAVTDPGSIIGKNSIIYPLTLIRDTIAANSIVKNKPSFEIVARE